MVGKVELSELLKTLRESGISKFRSSELGLELEFGPTAHLKEPMFDNTQQDSTPGAGDKEASNTPEETIDDDLLYHSARP